MWRIEARLHATYDPGDFFGCQSLEMQSQGLNGQRAGLELPGEPVQKERKMSSGGGGQEDEAPKVRPDKFLEGTCFS